MFTITVRDSAGHTSLNSFDDSIEEVSVGRGEGNDIILPLGNVSQRHCRIRRKGERFVILDLGSTNGTFVNRHQITRSEPIGPSDLIQVGDFTLILDPEPVGHDGLFKIPAHIMSQSGIATPEGTLSPRHLRVSARIVGPCASITMTQRFEAPQRRTPSAVYILPLGHKDVLSSFLARLNDRLIHSRVQAGAASSTQIPFTFACQRPGILVAGLGHLEEGEQVEITVRYSTLLEWQGRALRFSLPASVAPGNGPTLDGSPGLGVDVHIERPEWLSGVASSDGPWRASMGKDAWRVSFSRERACLTQDLVLLLDPMLHTQPTAWCVRNHQDQHTAVVHTVPTPPRQKPTSEVLFLLDCSDVFHGAPFDKAREVLRACLECLHESDTFNILWFGGHFASLWANTVNADQSNLADALVAIEKATATMGRKEVETVLQQALSTPQDPERMRSVVIITDGGIRDARQTMALSQHCAGHIHLALCGVFARGNGYLLEEMARSAEGLAVFADPGEPAVPVANQIMDWLGGPVINEPRIAWGEVDIEQAPSLCPPAHSGRGLTIFGRVQGELPQTISLLGGQAPLKVKVHHLDLGEEDPVGHLWAHSTIVDLETPAHTQRSSSISPAERIVQISMAHAALSGSTHLGTASDRPILMTHRWESWSPAQPWRPSHNAARLPALMPDPSVSGSSAAILAEPRPTGPQPAANFGGVRGRLYYEDATGETRVVHISHDFPEVTLGRNPGSVIRNNNLTVSRAHARFLMTGNTFTLFDLDSSHGTFVNGERITSRPLAHDDHIRCGDFDLRFELETLSRELPGLPEMTNENPLLVSPDNHVDESELKRQLKKAWEQQREDMQRIKSLEGDVERFREDHQATVRQLHEATDALRNMPNEAFIEELQRDLLTTRRERDAMGAFLTEVQGAWQRWEHTRHEGWHGASSQPGPSPMPLASPTPDILDDVTTALYSPSALASGGDWLQRLLATQLPDGSFRMSEELMRWLGPATDTIMGASAQHGEGPVVTSVLISLLTTDVSERAQDWGYAVDRAQAFLNLQPYTIDVGPLLGRPS